MGLQPIPPRRRLSAEEHVRDCYVRGLIDFDALDRALDEIIVGGRQGVPSYVPPRDPGKSDGAIVAPPKRGDARASAVPPARTNPSQVLRQ